MPITLKRYQETTLAALQYYLESARTIGAQQAFDGSKRVGIRNPSAYHPLKGLETVPYVCLRLPTGGGKTLLSAHSVKIAADAYLEREYPLVLWLVPTNTIRKQTLETLQKPDHPNYEALRRAFDGRFRVLDIADFAQITPDDIRSSTCVVVSTFAALRVTNTEGRKVYAHHEAMEPHFTTIPMNSYGLERSESGQLKYSFANVMAWHRPLVLVDEAHNNTSKLSIEVLQRVRAACVIEFTATPAADSNLLHNVSATELKAEQMIKLPIRLGVQNTWEEAVRDAILRRKHLHEIAAEDNAYIRPIVLFQAEDKGKDITKEILLHHLVEQEHIPREKIAVVTGDQKELDGINLFSRDCPIDYVITVEALKEGWDCSFAYVFCSVASVYSQKDVEQLLGRVLRQPYAKHRTHPDLNRAYAYVAKASWKNAVGQLHDSLVQMGFDDNEANQFIEKEPSTATLDLQGGEHRPHYYGTAQQSTTIELWEDISSLYQATAGMANNIQVKANDAGGSNVILQGNISEETLEQLVQTLPETAAAQIIAEVRVHNATLARQLAPSERGIPFTVPQLCLWMDDTWFTPDTETLLDVHGWNLLEYSPALEESVLRITEQGITWEIDLNMEGSLTERYIGKAEQYELDLVETNWSIGQLCGWLERKCRQPDITQSTLLEFVRRAMQYLLEERQIALSTLVRWRFVIAKLLKERIEHSRLTAGKKEYQQCLFAPQQTVETRFDYAFPFQKDGYVPHWIYQGRFTFTKHYYPYVGELEAKGEELACAKAIDMYPAVKHWVRNLSKRGFSLPLAHSKFYPDFMAELEDGRILAIEYKGGHLATADEAKEKALVGELWERSSNGKALFLMAEKEGTNKPSITEQIRGKVG